MLLQVWRDLEALALEHVSEMRGLVERLGRLADPGSQPDNDLAADDPALPPPPLDLSFLERMPGLRALFALGAGQEFKAHMQRIGSAAFMPMGLKREIR